MKQIALAALLVSVLSSCATVPAAVPTNVVMSNERDSSMSTVDFSYDASVPFKLLKMCIAENVTNDAVDLHGTSGVAGLAQALAGKYHSAEIVPGGAVFKYADESLGTIIAAGNIPTEGAAGFKGIVRFNLKATTKGSRVTLLFSNIEYALKYGDGSGSFSPVHPRQAFESTYAGLQTTANNIKACTR